MLDDSDHGEMQVEKQDDVQAVQRDEMKVGDLRVVFQHDGLAAAQDVHSMCDALEVECDEQETEHGELEAERDGQALWGDA